MKKTAVEWLANELYEKFEMRGDGILYDEILTKAKEMEKQQIIDAVDSANKKWRSQQSEFILNGQQYYNETFKNK